MIIRKKRILGSHHRSVVNELLSYTYTSPAGDALDQSIEIPVTAIKLRALR